MRGLRQIRSSAGKKTRAAVPKQSKDYQLYMQITCLEMEKVRRGVERSAALERIRRIDARLTEVEREKADLLRQLADRNVTIPADLDPFVPGSALATLPARNTFRIRY